jgi:hypothetical protein
MRKVTLVNSDGLVTSSGERKDDSEACSNDKLADDNC